MSTVFVILIEFAAYLFFGALCVDFILRFNGRAEIKRDAVFLLTLLAAAFPVFGRRFFFGFDLLSSLALAAISVGVTLKLYGLKRCLAAVAPILFLVLSLTASSAVFAAVPRFSDAFLPAVQDPASPVRCIFVLLSLVTVFAFSRLLLHVAGAERTSDRKGTVLIFVFSVGTAIGLCGTMGLALSDEAAERSMPILLIAFAFLLSTVFLYLLVGQTAKLRRARDEMQILEEKIRSEKERHEEVTAIWERVRRMKHDMKHHYAVILAQLQEGETEQCEAYVRDLLPAVDRIAKVVKTDTPTLDYIVNSKLSGVSGVDIVLAGSIGPLDDIEDSDLASLLGNILDNALEALAKLGSNDEKRLELLFAKQNSDRVIICKNTIKKSVLKTNGELRSTKPGRDHGLGHKVVAQIVEKYSGHVDYFEENGTFGVQIILPCPPPKTY